MKQAPRNSRRVRVYDLETGAVVMARPIDAREYIEADPGKYSLDPPKQPEPVADDPPKVEAPEPVAPKRTRAKTARQRRSAYTPAGMPQRKSPEE